MEENFHFGASICHSSGTNRARLGSVHVANRIADVHENGAAFRHQKGFSVHTSFYECFNDTIFVFSVQNAMLSALPYFVQWVVSIVCSQLADIMRERDIASTRTVRKLFNTIGKFCSS